MKMTEFVHTLQQKLSAESINFGNDADSVLSFLCNAYYDWNCSSDTDEIQQAFEELYEAMNGKTLREMDEIIYPVCSLCRVHQESGFIDGLKLGFLFSHRLSEYSDAPEPGVRRVRATIPVGQSQCSGQ